MGQATLTKPEADLPDPLQHSPDDLPDTALPTLPSSSADDLLSQLAGDDIDRLLAEAHAEQDVAKKPAIAATPMDAPSATTEAMSGAHPQHGASNPEQTALVSGSNGKISDGGLAPASDSVSEDRAGIAAGEASLDALFAELHAEPARILIDTSEVVHQPSPAAAQFTGEENQAHFAELDNAIAASAVVPAQESGATVEPVLQVPQSSIPPASISQASISQASIPQASIPQANIPQSTAPATSQAKEIEAEVDERERTALAVITCDDSADSLQAADVGGVAEDASTNEQDSSLPLPVRILEWVNYPLMLCSDELRDALGKIALLTLFNSIAVLTYVLLFRKHPHH